MIQFTCMNIFPQRQMLVSLIITVLFYLNWFFIQNSFIGIFIGTAYLLWFGYLTGNKLFSEKSEMWKFFWGIFILESLLILMETISYYLYSLASPMPIIILTIYAIGITLIKKQTITINLERGANNFEKTTILLSTAYLAVALVLLSMLFSASTLEPVRGPWDTLGTKYIVFFGIATLLWILLLAASRSMMILIASSTAHFFLASGIALILFPLGFGFDSFLHRAAEKVILEQGVIFPKTPYYIGEYALVIFNHYLTLLPIDLLDKMLLPFLFSLFLPSLAIITTRYLFPSGITVLTSALLLLLPLTSFIQTTPQGLGNLYVLITILWYLLYAKDKTKLNLVILLFFTAATTSIHPIAGIPLIIWLIGIFFFKKLKNWNVSYEIKHTLWGIIFIFLSIILPLIFFLSGKLSGTLDAVFRIPSLLDFTFTNLFSIETFEYVKQWRPIFDFIYLYRFNWLPIFLTLSVIGIGVYKRKKNIPGGDHLIVGFGLIFLNSVFLKLFIQFKNLIFYEQNDFQERLFMLSLYFLIPFFISALLTFWNALKGKYARGVFLALLSAVITAPMYTSYPRYDAYELVRSFNTSRYDIEAVNLIEQDAEGDYVVLANQAVSAAAVQELGFKKYYNGHFFYPIPTGGKLYQIYLDMVYKTPSRENAEKAAELTGVKTIYFVLNDYWNNSKNIREEALLEANVSFTIENGKITIFKYNFN